MSFIAVTINRGGQKDETSVSTGSKENKNFVHLLLPDQLRTVLSFIFLSKVLDELMLTVTTLALLRISTDLMTMNRHLT